MRLGELTEEDYGCGDEEHEEVVVAEEGEPSWLR